MKTGTFGVCWLLSDSEIISKYNREGRKAFANTEEQCATCHDRSCPINTGFTDKLRSVRLESCVKVIEQAPTP